MHITTNTLKRIRSAFTLVLLSLSLTTVAACEQVTTAVAQAGVGPSTESRTVAVFSGRVVGITDGDTLTLLDARNQQHTIRLAEIDAPERAQPWGTRARQTLSTLVFGKTVSVQQTDTDRYGRVVGRIFAEGEDVNRAMVEQGAAWAYRRYLTDRTLLATEARARQQRVGLWSMSDAQTVAPWDWRQGVRVGEGAPIEPAPNAQVRSLFASGGSANATTGDDGRGGFSCGTKRYCRQMSSCAEANFYLRQCGVSSLDGDDDGRPCETLC